EIRPRRRIAVLGDMRELGSVSEEEHRIVGRRAAEMVDLLVTYGDLARTIATEAQAAAAEGVDARQLAVTSFGLDQREEVVTYLLGELREGDTVLLKGSRGLEMENFVAALAAAATPAAPTPAATADIGAGGG